MGRAALFPLTGAGATVATRLLHLMVQVRGALPITATFEWCE